MSDNKAPLPKLIKMIIYILTLAIAAGGYILFYQSQNRIAQREKEYEIIKEKNLHTDENLNELQKKYDETTDAMKQTKNEHESLKQKEQECKGNLTALQKKFDDLSLANQKLQTEMKELQQNPAKSTEPTKPKDSTSLNTPNTDAPTTATSQEDSLQLKTSDTHEKPSDGSALPH